MNYFPYHEMDIMHIVSLFQDRINKNNALKQIRKQRNLTQYELSILSGVPERTIESYE
ncbi:MAG: helix-turn-helix transcriptional regulator [Bacilli bacterium]|nr:helix-turn-helix transcriptional regulator [Bacilli bacterium]